MSTISRDLLSLWEGSFPQHSDALLRGLEPLLAWKPIRILPEMPGVFERCRTATYWRQVAEVKPLRVTKVFESWSDMNMTIGASLRVRYFRAFDKDPDALQMLGHLEMCTLRTFGEPLRNSLLAPLGKPVWDKLWDSFKTSVNTQCMLVLTGKHDQAAHMQAFNQLWPTDNLPFMFDRDGALRVLVAG